MRRSRSASATAVLAALLMAACTAAPAQAPPRVTRAETADVPRRDLPLDTGRGSGQPRLSRTPSGDLVVSWLEPDTVAGRTRLRVATRAARGGNWSVPRTVAAGQQWFVNWADVPGVVPVSDTTWVAHWLERSDPPSRYAYDVRVALSQDAGITWGAPFTPHRDGTRTEHGFVSVFAWPGTAASDVGLAWLDGREMQSGAAHSADHGDMTLRTARLSADGALHDEVVLDRRVCECCPTATINTADGVLVAYRNRGDDETRDIHVVRHEGGWQTDHVAVADDWQIAACPVNGPALSVRERDIALAWFTAVREEPRVKVAFSRDGGRTWTAGATIDGGRPLGRAAVVHHPEGGVVVSWVEAEDTGATVRLRRVHADGRMSGPFIGARVAQSRLSGYPRLAVADDGVMLAWVEGVEHVTQVATGLIAFADLR